MLVLWKLGVFGECEERGLLDIGGIEGEIVVETENEFAVAMDADYIARQALERTMDAYEFLTILGIEFEWVRHNSK